MADGDLTGRALGDFILGERLGGGAQGVVYRAYQPALGRDVVIKVLRPQSQRNVVAQERFLREAKLASLLDHPYAAHVYAFDVEPDGLMWIAMELVHGITLQAWLAERGPMPLDQLVPFIEHVTKVVHAAHQHGIVHRDLKPSNVMVIEQDGSRFPKLLDFGVAKAPPEIASLPLSPGAIEVDDAERARHKRGSSRSRGEPHDERITATNSAVAGSNHPGPLTHPGSGLGSSAYMAPEQWREAWTVGPAVDIYALGVIAYRALLGEEPFTGPDVDDYYRQHQDAPPPRIVGELAPVDRVIQRALAKSSEDRHASALDFSADLRAALRASEREQLRAAAQQWEDRRRSPGLLWGREELPDLERWARRAPGLLNPLECSFVAASHRSARRAIWNRRALFILIVGGLFTGLLYHSNMEARLATREAAFQAKLAATTITQSELEQGRAALLHGEYGAVLHLQRAYRRDPEPSTAFMLSRALQPRLAERAVLHSFSGRMWSASFSPRGDTVVTSDDQDARLWDAKTGGLRATLPHGAPVYSATYFSDGSRIVSADADGKVRIWDTRNAKLMHTFRPPSGSPHYYSALASPDGSLVAAINVEGTVANVWDIATGSSVAEITNDGSERPDLAFSADSRWLATTGGDDVRVFDTRQRRSMFKLAGPRIECLAFDPTGPRLVTASATGDVSLWSVLSGKRLRRMREIGEPVSAVAASPDGRLLAAGSRTGELQVWKVASGELVHQMRGHCTRIQGLEFDSASQRIAVACADGVVVIDDVASGLPSVVLSGSRGSVRMARFSPDGGRVVAPSNDGTARIWDTASAYSRWRSGAVADDCGVIRTPDPDRRFIADACRDSPTRIWDVALGKMIAELPAVTHVDGGFASAFPVVSADGSRAAIARGHLVAIYEVPSGKLLRTVQHAAAVNSVAFAPSGHDLISGAVDGGLVVTRDAGAVLSLPAMAAGVDAVGLLADGRAVVADASHHLRVYDQLGAIVGELVLPGRSSFLRETDGHLVTVPIDPTYETKASSPTLIGLRTYTVIAQLDKHIGRVFSARWVRGHRVLTAGMDGTARMWDGLTGAELQVFRSGARFLADATLRDDDTVIATGADGTVRFWEAGSGRLLWAMQAHRASIGVLHVDGNAFVTRAFDGEIAGWVLPDPGEVLRSCEARAGCDTVD